MKPARYAWGLACVLVIRGVLASDSGTITVNGMLRTGTCNVSVGGGGANATIVLPPQKASDLSGAGQIAGKSPFRLSLDSCHLGGEGKVYVYFHNDQASLDPSGRLNNISSGSPAGNIQLEVLNSTGGALNLKATENLQNAGPPQSPSVGAGAAFDYFIQYYATGVSTPGTVSSSLTLYLG
jgi:major type 1 subunit fimbrin (pilin)